MRHGTEAEYARRGCRCDVCRQGRYRRAKGYRHQRQHDPLVDAEPMREHLQALAAEGFGIVPMLALAGWAGIATVATLPARIHRSRVDAVLALTRDRLLAELPDTARVPVVGARRRIRALQALGWPLHAITPGSILARNTVARPRPMMTAGNHRTIVARYESLSMTPGPSRSAMMRSDGVTPITWDDDALDDPAAQPWRPPRYGVRSRIDPDDVSLMLTAGLSPEGVARRLGVQPESLTRQLQRIGRTDLLARLERARIVTTEAIA